MKTSRINKPHRYLTEVRARALKPGDQIKIGYDDFNKGKDEVTVISVHTEEHPPSFRLELESRATAKRCATRWYSYLFLGQHRDGTTTPIMCRGSGAERIFLQPTDL